MLTVNGKALALPDLEALEQVTADVEGKSYRGVRLLDVLKAASATSGEIVFKASDGHEAGVAVGALTNGLTQEDITHRMRRVRLCQRQPQGPARRAPQRGGSSPARPGAAHRARVPLPGRPGPGGRPLGDGHRAPA